MNQEHREGTIVDPVVSDGAELLVTGPVGHCNVGKRVGNEVKLITTTLAHLSLEENSNSAGVSRLLWVDSHVKSIHPTYHLLASQGSKPLETVVSKSTTAATQEKACKRSPGSE